MKNLVFFVVAVALLGTSLAATVATTTTTTEPVTVTDPPKTDVTAKPAVPDHDETQHGPDALKKLTNVTINTKCFNKTSCKDCFATKEDDCQYMFFLFEHGVHGLCIEKDQTLSDLEDLLFKDTEKPRPYKTIFSLESCPSCGKHDSSCDDCLAEPDLECSFVHDKNGTKTSCIEENADFSKYQNGTAVHHGKACPKPKKDQPKPAPPQPQPKTSGFDGSSFFGGIILTVALPTVAFVGYKFYQRRQRGGTHQSF